MKLLLFCLAGVAFGTSATSAEPDALFVLSPEKQKNYKEAVDYCKSIDRTVASVHTKEENEELSTLLLTSDLSVKEPVYLGAYEISDGDLGLARWHDLGLP